MQKENECDEIMIKLKKDSFKEDYKGQILFMAATLLRGVITQTIPKSKYPYAIGNLLCLWIGLELSRCSNERERNGHIDGRGGIRFPLLTAADIAL